MRVSFDKWNNQLADTLTGRDETMAWAGYQAAINDCLEVLSISRASLLLMAGEMTAQELRTVKAVLEGLKSKIASEGIEVP